jgi:hypothetical protein
MAAAVTAAVILAIPAYAAADLVGLCTPPGGELRAIRYVLPQPVVKFPARNSSTLMALGFVVSARDKSRPYS